MINWDNLEQATVNVHPYKHIFVDNLIDADYCEMVYAQLRPGFYDNQQPNMGGWPLLHADIPMASNLISMMSHWEGWNNILNSIGALHKQNNSSAFGYQANAHDINFGPHNDDQAVTGCAAKILIYITPNTPGTKVYSGPYEQGVDNEVSEGSGAVGSAFIFPCTPHSYHGTDFSSLTQDSKRIIIAGQWNG